MGVIINIDEALELRSDYNILREPLNEMIRNKQEAWEKQNPIDFLFNRGSISTFQQTYTSSVGFNKAFAETGDYAIGPIYNTAEGFSATYRTRTFQGSFIITQQTLEDREMSRAKDDASAFVRRWHGDIVEYCMAALSAGFGAEVEWGDKDNGGVSTLLLNSADTVDGKLASAKNPLFTNKHNIIRRKTMSDTDIQNAQQSNCFYADIDITGDDPARLSKLADVIYQVKVYMENIRNDNNKYAGVDGAKSIVIANDAHLKAALDTIVSKMDYRDFGYQQGTNPAYEAATVNSTPYLNDIPQTANGRGFFIVDKSYAAENHGLELTERIPFTLDVLEEKRPKGIIYQGRQRFDINVADWRSIAYVYLGVPAGASGNWDDVSHFTKLTPAATVVKPVSIVGTVQTEAAGG
jgi:hypothetical protein